MDILILWSIRVGVLLLVISFFFMRKKKSKKVLRILDNRDNFYKSKQTKFVRYLDSLTDNSFFKLFTLKESSEGYKKTKDLLIKSGNESGLTVDIVQTLRIMIPIIIFVFGVIIIGTMGAVNKFTIMNSLENNGNVVSNMYSFIQPVADVKQASGGDSSTKLMLLLLVSLVSYKLPDFILKQSIKKRNNKIKQELNVIESFAIVMLETGNFSIYEILQTIVNSNSIDILKPIIFSCMNEYYINPTVAIQNMADKVQNEEFQVVCNTLKDAIGKNKEFINRFMNENIEQLKKYQRYEIQKRIKQKPMVFVLLLAIPLFNIVIIWMYPWITKVFKMLTGGFMASN